MQRKRMMQYYYRQSGNPFVNVWRRSLVNKIIFINVAVFIVLLFLDRSITMPAFSLVPRFVVTKGYVWQLVTYMFIHYDFIHIALNMFVIWMFGTILESSWGSSRFLRFYLFCGLGGAVLSFLPPSFNSFIYGASGAAYGALAAFAVLYPYNEIYFLGIFPVKARTLVIVFVAIELLLGFSGGTGIAHLAHLGGMVAGVLYTRRDHRGWWFWSKIDALVPKLPVRISFDRDAQSQNDDIDDPGKIDSILDKIAAKGYENLTETEKRILENYSRKTQKH
ncbi:MAG: rhomboid family intramembrane serine protease [bacterium]|nr:MAG: rhomboid family intramembrane serine protease [bacterium]